MFHIGYQLLEHLKLFWQWTSHTLFWLITAQQLYTNFLWKFSVAKQRQSRYQQVSWIELIVDSTKKWSSFENKLVWFTYMPQSKFLTSSSFPLLATVPKDARSAFCRGTGVVGKSWDQDMVHHYDAFANRNRF